VALSAETRDVAVDSLRTRRLFHAALFFLVALLTPWAANGFGDRRVEMREAVAFGVFTKVFAISEGLLPEDPKLTFSKIKVNLERGLILGVSLVLTGLVCSAYSVWTWKRASFGMLDSAHTLRIIIPAITALIIGAQIVFSSFFLSVLGLRRR